MLLIHFGCGSSNTVDVVTEKESEGTYSPEEQKGRQLLNSAIDAQGGMEVWNSFEGLQYTILNNGKASHQLTNIHDRRANVRAENFEIGYDGKVAWATPNMDNVPGKSAAFYFNLDFYFVAIPFVLKDPGVHVSSEGLIEVNGKSYEALKVWFGDGVGFTPKDVYYLYLDPQSKLLEILVYSVSFIDKSETPGLNSAKVYSDWKEVQGLKMPGKMENFAWKDGEMGESSGHLRILSDYKFLKEVDTGLFEVPDGAITEPLGG